MSIENEDVMATDQKRYEKVAEGLAESLSILLDLHEELMQELNPNDPLAPLQQEPFAVPWITLFNMQLKVTL
jgi:hypothetical protein